VHACCSRTAHKSLLAKAADKVLYARLSSIVAVASAFIFAHESAVNDISRCGTVLAPPLPHCQQTVYRTIWRQMR